MIYGRFTSKVLDKTVNLAKMCGMLPLLEKLYRRFFGMSLFVAPPRPLTREEQEHCRQLAVENPELFSSDVRLHDWQLSDEELSLRYRRNMSGNSNSF